MLEVMAVVLVLALALFALLLSQRLVQRFALERVPLLELLDPDRRNELLALFDAASVLHRVAILAGPFALLAMAAQPLRQRGPLAGIGLACHPRGFLGWLHGGLDGYVCGMVSLLTLAALAGPQLDGTSVSPLQWVVLQTVRSGVSVWDAGAAAVGLGAALFVGYAVGRVVLVYGLLGPILDDLLPPAAVSVVTGLVFAAGYLLSPFITPLAFVNLWLAGLLLDRLRRAGGALWYPLGLLGGWVVAGALARVPAQGMLGGGVKDAFATLPAVLSGGSYGFEGGLITTLILAVGLLLSGWPVRAAPRVDEAASAGPSLGPPATV